MELAQEGIGVIDPGTSHDPSGYRVANHFLKAATRVTGTLINPEMMA
jgi:hypothetical protein